MRWSEAEIMHITGKPLRAIVLKSLALICSLSMFVSPTCFGEVGSADKPLIFAGYGYETALNQLEDKLGYTDRFLDAERQQQLVSTLGSIVEAAPSELMISTNELGRLGRGAPATVLALVITSEMVHVETIGDTQKLLVELNAQTMAFDFNSRQIVWARPMSAQHIDVFDRSPNSSDVNVALNKIIFGDFEYSIVRQFKAQLASMALDELDGTTLRVTDIDFGELAAQQYQQLTDTDINVARSMLANQFTLALAAGQGVAVIPSASAENGQALGNTMKARMADGSVYNLRFPEPDYHIKITLDEFKKVETGRSGSVVVNVYGVFATFVFEEPLSGSRFFDEQIKFGVAQRLPTSAIVGNDWLAFYEVSEALFNSFVSEMDNPSNDWGNRHITTTDRPLRSLRRLQDLIEQCR